MHRQVDVADLKLNPLTKQELLSLIEERIRENKKTFLTTLYSEFLYHSLRDREVRGMLNKADIAIADGIGVIWAEYFLSRPFSFSGYYLKIVQAWWQVVYTGASILLSPKSLYRVFPEKIVGADLFWDLASLANENNYSLYLLGGYGDTTQRVKEKLLVKFPTLNIVGASNKSPNETGTIVEDIKNTKPDMLLVAFSSITQERWIVQHFSDLPIKFAVGLGGTFDYVTGKRLQPPKFVRSLGLEWFYRLFTQPHRIVRIYQAFWGLILSLVRYKVFMNSGFRKNAAAVVIDKENKILIVKRNPHDPYLISTGDASSKKFNNYWQFPRGGVDGIETYQQAAKRELWEEVGLSDVEFMSLAPETTSYEWNNAKRPLLGNVYKHKGQEQHIVFFKYLGDSSEIKLDNRELVDYMWVDIGDLNSIFNPELHSVVQIVEKYCPSQKTA